MYSNTRLWVPLLFCTLGVIAHSSGEDLKNLANRADVVYITPQVYFSRAEILSSHRQVHNGLAAMVVSLDSVVAQFRETSAPDTAIRDFIHFALHFWSEPRPRTFVLVGNTNVMPSHVEKETFPSWLWPSNYDSLLRIDQWFIEAPDTAGKIAPGVCIARLPAWDTSGLSTIINKTIAYESEPAGAWTSHSIMIADQDSFAGFEADADLLLPVLGSAWNDTTMVHIRPDSPSHIDSASFISLWDNGASVLAYMGHAGNAVLSRSHYFSTSSVDGLSNGNRLPVCIFGGCDLRFDSDPPVPLVTHLLDRPQGGAVLVVASAALMFENTACMFLQDFLTHLASNRSGTVGDAFVGAKGTGSDGLRRRFTLLGDPSLRVQRPSMAGVGAPGQQPSAFQLFQNYPNPFNPETVIKFSMPGAGRVKLAVYDLLGREIAVLYEGSGTAGFHSVTWSGRNAASGVYIARLVAQGDRGIHVSAKAIKMVLTK